MIPNKLKYLYNFAKKIWILQKIRKKFKNSKTKLTINDLGAGSKFAKSKEKFISSIAKNESSPLSKSLLLCLIAKISKAQIILELGTNLGLNANCLALAFNKVITIEGDSKLVKYANYVKRILDNYNLLIINSSFDLILNQTLKNYQPDFIIIDGNHKGSATKYYVENIYKSIKNKNFTILIDDIRWSKDMFKAWSTLSLANCKKIDFFSFGLLKCKK